MADALGAQATTRRARARPDEPRLHLRLALLLLIGFVAGCSGVLNPPVPTSTPLPTVPPLPTAMAPTATPEPEQWVKNHRLTEMWSGPSSDRGAISFGLTSNTFCSFRIEDTEDDARIFVYNPYSDGSFWIDVESVGPVDAPELRRGPKPADQNCSEARYDGTPSASPSPSPSPDRIGTPRS